MYAGIILFSIGVPICSAVFLMRNKESLETEGFLNSYGFLYEEYENDFCFWESIVMLRKFLVVTVLIFLSSVGIEIQLLSALGVVMFSMILQVSQSTTLPNRV